MKTLFILLIPTFCLCDCELRDALVAVRPLAEWSLRGEDYAGLKWIDKSQTKPSEAEINTAISNCRAQAAIDKQQREQAVIDARNSSKSTQERIDALIKAIDLK